MQRVAAIGIGLVTSILSSTHALGADAADLKGERESLPGTNWEILEPQLAQQDAELFFSCGRNALYIFFLHLYGENAVSFDEVKALVPVISPYGTSLNSLLQAAVKLHCDAEVRLYNLKDYASVPLPAVVHLRRGPVVGISHFDVMYKRDAHWVYLIDGTTAEPYKSVPSKFSEGHWWTGYALIQKRSVLARLLEEQWVYVGAPLLIANALLFVNVGIKRWGRVNHRTTI